MSKQTWAIIAAKDEESTIQNVVNKTKNYVDKIIVVNDGSDDNTDTKAHEAGAIVLTHIVNMGKGTALKTGSEYAIANGADRLVYLDADGQHKPEEIERLIKPLDEVDIVLGARVKRKQMPGVLKFGNWGISLITEILFGMKVSDTQCGFRAMRKETYAKVKWKSAGYSVESEMIANIGKQKLKYREVPISTIYADRYKGTTIIDGMKIVGNLFWWRIAGW